MALNWLVRLCFSSALSWARNACRPKFGAPDQRLKSTGSRSRLLVDVAQGLADIGHGQRVEAGQQARAGLHVLQLQQRRLQCLDLLDLHVEARGIAAGQAATARPEALPHGLGRRAGGGVQDRVAIARVERRQGALVVAAEVVEEAQRLGHADVVDAQQGVLRQRLAGQGHGDEVLGLQVIDGAFQAEQVIGQQRRPCFTSRPSPAASGGAIHSLRNCCCNCTVRFCSSSTRSPSRLLCWALLSRFW